MKSDTQKQGKKGKSRNYPWIIGIFVSTVLISALLSAASETLLGGANLASAFLILLVIVLIGVVFDVVGVAVTAADPKPFHSMAAHRVRGAQEALRLLKNAEKVSSFCNDVIGDVCGVVSGAAAATIAGLIVSGHTAAPWYLGALLAALVSGVTVGGKAAGKTLALRQSTRIVHMTANVIYWVKYPVRAAAKKRANAKKDRG